MANARDKVKIPYSLAPNSLPGADGYHRVLSHVGSKDCSVVFEGVAEKLPGQTPAGAELVWSSMVGTIAENMVKYQYKCSVNGVSFALAIPGSTTSINGSPSEDVYVSITSSLALRNSAVGITPVYSSDETDVPSMKSVENLADHKSDKIVGTESFRVSGNNLTVVGDDETITVIAADGTEAVAEVIREDGYGMFIDARLSAALPPGKGKVVLKTHGKRTPEGELRVLSKSVTILAGEEPPPPEPTPIAQTSDGQVKVMSVADGGQSETFAFGHEWTVSGEGFAGSAAEWFPELASVRAAPGADAIMATCQAVDANTLKIACDEGDAPASGDYPNATLDIGMARYVEGELTPETLTIPIHLTVE